MTSFSLVLKAGLVLMNEGERTDTDSCADQHVCVAFVWQPCVVCNHIQKNIQPCLILHFNFMLIYVMVVMFVRIWLICLTTNIS